MSNVIQKAFNVLAEQFAQNFAPLAARLQTHSFRLSQLETRIADAPQGPPGPRGEVGPMPIHRWDGTRLQFEQGPNGGEWGEAVDLVGPAGRPGRNGSNGASGLGAASRTTTSYFPGGWG